MTCMWSVRGAVRGLQGRWGVKVPSLLGRLGGSVENRGLVWLYEMTDVRAGWGGAQAGNKRLGNVSGQMKLK